MNGRLIGSMFSFINTNTSFLHFFITVINSNFYFFLVVVHIYFIYIYLNILLDYYYYYTSKPYRLNKKVGEERWCTSTTARWWRRGPSLSLTSRLWWRRISSSSLAACCLWIRFTSKHSNFCLVSEEGQVGARISHLPTF